jgi:NAD(P)-dependent dehydrogenase (short-subunit alcohol dehydrogenase family)
VSAKHGVIGLTKTAALDYADHNPRVKARAPGPILTDNLRRAGAQAQAAAAAVMPMRRVGQPEEVAWTAVSLCSDQARFITGVHHRRDPAHRRGKLAGTPNVRNHPPATSR